MVEKGSHNNIPSNKYLNGKSLRAMWKNEFRITFKRVKIPKKKKLPILFTFDKKIFFLSKFV